MSMKISTVIDGVHSGTIVLPGDVLTCQMAGQFADSAWMTDGTTKQDIETAVLKGKMVVCTLLNQSISSEPITLFAQSVLSPYPVFTGICKIGNNLAYISVTYDEDSSTPEYEVWNVQRYSGNGAEVFECTFTFNSGTNVYGSMDKTPAEIRSAVNSGKIVVCNAYYDRLYLVAHVGSLVFNRVFDNGSLTIYYAENLDSWMMQSITLQPLLTIDNKLSETSPNPVQNKAINVLTRQLWNRVDVVSRIGVEYASANNYIASSGTYVGQWRQSTSYKHWIVPVDGIRAVAVQAGTSDSYPTFLRNYESTTGTPDYATGYTGVTRVEATKTKIFTVPSGAKYMYLNTGQNDTAKPAHVYMSGAASNQPQLEYIKLSAGATTCNITLNDTKQSFVIDNSENSNNVSINITNLYDYVYSNEYITAGKGIVTQFDFESIEIEQKTYLFVKQTVVYERT